MGRHLAGGLDRSQGGSPFDLSLYQISKASASFVRVWYFVGLLSFIYHILS